MVSSDISKNNDLWHVPLPGSLGPLDAHGRRIGVSSPELMISIIIPCLNAEKGLKSTLCALKSAERAGFTPKIIIADGGSTDATREIAEAAGTGW